MQRVRDDILKEYRKAGIFKVDEFTEPEDHVALELQFMAYQCGKMEEALQKGDDSETGRLLEVQKDFLDKHLSIWIPRLTKDILESGRAGFYRGAAKITEAFIKMDKETVDGLLEGREAE